MPTLLPKTPLSRLCIASVLACAALAATPVYAQVSANPVAQTIVNEANAAGRVLFVSGASAPAGGFGEVAATLFEPGTVFRFTPLAATGRGAGDHQAFAGRLRTAAGGWAAGSAAIIVNRTLGGSSWGVNPVARAEAIEALVVTTDSCTAGTGTAAAPFRCGVTAGTAASPHRVPHAGISDLHPRLFAGAINNEGETPVPALTPDELARLETFPIFNLGFGVPVTNNVPDLRLNRPALSGIMTGLVDTWGEVDAGLPPTIANADMLIARRVPGSGTQAVANLYFGFHPCTGTTNTPADRDAREGIWDAKARTVIVEGNVRTADGTVDEPGQATVVELSTSGDVRNFLQAAVEASNKEFRADAVPARFDPATGVITPGVGYTHYFMRGAEQINLLTANRDGDSVLVQFRNGRVHAAVGLLSLDSLDRAVNWSFRSLDGAGRMTWVSATTPPTVTGTGRHPTVANMVDGTWDKMGVISFNLPQRTTGNMAALARQFVAASSDPRVQQAQPRMRFGAVSVHGTPPMGTVGRVQRVAYVGGDQCGPLNLRP